MGDFVFENEKKQKPGETLGEYVRRSSQSATDYQNSLRDEYKIDLNLNEYTEIENLVESAPTPEDQEEIKGRLAGSYLIKNELGLDLKTAYDNYDAIIENLYGADVHGQPKRNVFTALKDSFTMGKNTLKMGTLGNELTEAESRGDLEKAQYILQEYQAVMDQNKLLQDNSKRGIVMQGLEGALQSTPFTLTAAALGVIPAIGPAVSFGFSSLNAQGLEYIEARSRGATVEQARTESLIVGAINGGIELTLGNVAGAMGAVLVKAGGKPIAELAKRKVISNAIEAVTSKMHNAGMFKAIAETGARYALENVEEGLEEVLQDTAAYVGQVILKQLNKDNPEYDTSDLDFDTFRNELAESFKGGFLSSIFMGLPAAGINASVNFAEFKNVSDMATSIPSKEDFTKRVKDSPLFKGMKEEEKAKVISDIYDKKEERRQKNFQKQEQDIAEVYGADDILEVTDKEMDAEGEVTSETIPELYKTEKGKLYTETESTGDNTYRFKAGNAASGKSYGYIDYKVDNDTGKVTIESFKMAEHREALRNEMFLDFAKNTAGYQVEWNAKGKLANDIKQQLASINPSGAKNGLSFYTDLKANSKDVDARVETARELTEKTNLNSKQISSFISIMELAAKNLGKSIAEFKSEVFGDNILAGSDVKGRIDNAIADKLRTNLAYLKDGKLTDARSKELQYDRIIAAANEDFATLSPEARSLLPEYVIEMAGKKGMLTEEQLKLLNDEIAQAPSTVRSLLGKEIAKAEAYGIKGAQLQVDTANGIRSVIYAAENADFSTFVHELAHVWRKQLDGDLLAEAEKAFGVEAGAKWTEKQEEDFARSFEEYLRTGKAKNTALRQIFHDLAQFLAQVYNYLKDGDTVGGVTLNKDIVRVFDDLLKGDNSVLREADNAVYVVENEEIQAARREIQAEEVARKAAAPAEEKNVMSDTSLDGVTQEAMADIIDDPSLSENEKINAGLNAAGEKYGADIKYDPEEIEKKYESGEWFDLFQIIGEKGARELDRMQYRADAMSRDQLRMKAEEMRHAGKSEKEIARETMWQYDEALGGNWTEVADGELKDVTGLIGKVNNVRRAAYILDNTNSSSRQLEAAVNILDSQLALMDGKLADYYDASEVYAAYPGMADVPVIFIYTNTPVRATFTPKGISVNLKFVDDTEKIRTSFVHEIQHIIQAIESMGNMDEAIMENAKQWNTLNALLRKAKGTNFEEKSMVADKEVLKEYFASREFAEYYNSAEEKQARTAQKRAGMSDRERSDTLFRDTDGQRILFQIIGEQGAAALDKAEDRTQRIDDLKVAMDMEAAGKDAKAIRLATGWEKGVDGKWKYEIADELKLDTFGMAQYKRDNPKYKEMSELEDKYFVSDLTEEEEARLNELYEEVGKVYVEPFQEKLANSNLQLKDIINNEELFMAYPQLRDVNIWFGEIKGDYNTEALFTPEHNAIVLFHVNPKNLSWSTNKRNVSKLIHEIQHVIQGIEGFAQGGNPNQLVQEYRKRIFDRLNEVYSKYQNDEQLKTDFDEYRKIWNKVQAAPEDNFMEAYDELFKYEETHDNVMKFNKELEQARKELGLNNNMEAAPLFNGTVLDTWKDNEYKDIEDKLARDYYNFHAMDDYRAIAGEVEARNVQSRMSMNAAQRREQLLADTEDVQRDDQIVLFQFNSFNDFKNSYPNAVDLSATFGRGKTDKEVKEFLRRISNKYYVTLNGDKISMSDQYDHIEKSAKYKTLNRRGKQDIKVYAYEIEKLIRNALPVTNRPKIRKNSDPLKVDTDYFVYYEVPVWINNRAYNVQLDCAVLKENASKTATTNVVSPTRNGSIPGNIIMRKAKLQVGNISYLYNISETLFQEDNEYEKAVKSGDIEKAKGMLAKKAAENGYVKQEYFGEGSWAAPTAVVEKQDFSNLDAMREYLDDFGGEVNIYGIINGLQGHDDDYYFNPDRAGFHGQAASDTAQVYRKLRYNKAGPDTKITVYRAVPNDVKGEKLLSGDWIALSKKYCEEHGEGRYGAGNYHIIEAEAAIKDIWQGEEDMREFGFDDGSKDIEKNVSNNRKLMEITYDENGNLIPLSQRFNENNPSILFQEENWGDIEPGLAGLAKSFLTWQEFQEACESEWLLSDEEKEELKPNADAAWYQNFWEIANNITPTTQEQEQAVAEEYFDNGNTESDPITKDVLFKNELKKPGVLERFMEQMAYIMRDEEEFYRDRNNAMDEEEAQQLDAEIWALNQIKALKHVSITSNLKGIANGRRLNEGSKKQILGLINNSLRAYRRIYSIIMGDSRFQVNDIEYEAETQAMQADAENLGVKLEKSVTDMSPEERRKLADEIKNERIKQDIISGKITFDDDTKDYINSVKAQRKDAEDRYNKLKAQTDEDWKNLADAQQRDLLKQYGKLLDLKSELEIKKQNVPAKLNASISATSRYHKDLSALKANYNVVSRQWDDLAKAIEISAETRAKLDRLDNLRNVKQEYKDLRKEERALANLNNIRKKLVKRIMRNVNFKTVDFETAKALIAIQRIFDPNVREGIDKWIGKETIDAREIWSDWKTDEEERKRIYRILEKSPTGRKVAEHLDKTKTEREFDAWSEKEKRDLERRLNKSSWYKELQLQKLKYGREDAIQLDIEEKEQSYIADYRNGEEIYKNRVTAIYSDEIAALVEKYAGADLLNKISSKPFETWSLAEMEDLVTTFNDIYREGRDLLNAKHIRENMEADAIRAAIVDQVNRTKIVINDDDPPEVKEKKQEKINKILGLSGSIKGTRDDSKRESKFNVILHGYHDANIRRVARILDGYTEGTCTNLLYWQENECFNREQKAKERRQAIVAKAMADNDIKVSELAKTIEVQLDNGVHKFSLDEILFFAQAERNNTLYAMEQKAQGIQQPEEETSYMAVVYGNLVSEEEKAMLRDQDRNALDAELERKAALEKAILEGDEEAIKEYEKVDSATHDLAGNLLLPGTQQIKVLARSRMESVLAAYNSLDGKFKKLQEAIAADYEKEFDRIQRTSIEEFNQPVWREKWYLPLIRLTAGGDTHEARVRADLMGAAAGTGKAGTEKGFTQKRVRISELNQTPVETGLYKTWQDSVDRTEHFVAYAGYVRKLNRVFANKDAQATMQRIEGRYGKGMKNYLQSYIKEVANPSAGNPVSDMNKIIRLLRGKAAPAYLSWKLSSIVKQALSSPAPFAQFISPAEYARAALKLTNSETRAAIAAKSQFMRTRSYDPILDIIEEENAKAQKNPITAKIADLENKGMQGLEWIDFVCVAPGWLAIYEKERAALMAKNEELVAKRIAELTAENESASYSDRLTKSQIEEAARGDVEVDIEAAAVDKADDCVRLCQPSNRKADLAPMFKSESELQKAFLQFTTSLNVIWQNIRYDIPYAVRNGQYQQIVGMCAGYCAAGIAMGLVCDGLFTGEGADDTAGERVRRFIYYSLTQYTDAFPIIGSIATGTLEKLVTGKGNYMQTNDVFPTLTKFKDATFALTDQNYKKAAERFAEGLALSSGLPLSGTKEALRVIGIGDKEPGLTFKPEALVGRR